MGRLALRNKKIRYGVIIDIGSGSVLTAIIASSAQESVPTIIWAHRELAPLKHIEAIRESAKGVMTALVTASMKLDSEGRRALNEYDSSASLTHTQVAISAPWCYTISKTVNYQQDEEFAVTTEMIEDLIAAAERQVDQELIENESASPLGLTVITKSTMDVLSNGYRVKRPEGDLAASLQLSQATVVAQQYLIDAIKEMQSKLFQRTSLQQLSFMLMMYCTARQHLPHTDDICLIDVTYEATEMGIIRDGSLHYSTHTSFGLFSLAREIAAATNLPLTETFNQLRTENPDHFFKQQSESVQTEIDSIQNAYIEKVSALLHETGDALSIPKRIFLNVDHSAEPFITKLIEKAAKKATRVEHVVTSVADSLGVKTTPPAFTDTAKTYENDTALILSAKFFHKPEHCLDFKYL